MTDDDVTAALRRVEAALARLDDLDDGARAAATDALEAVVAVYAEGFARILGAAHRAAPGSAGSIAADDLVSHLLVIHGLHPDPVGVRVEQALEELRGHVPGQAEVALVAVEDGVARVRVSSGSGCSSSLDELRQAVEEALAAAAPELRGVVAEEAPAEQLIPLESLVRRPASPVT